MHAANFNLDDYLHRIAYSGARDTTADTLSAIMQHQLRAIPFENLDVQAGKIVSMVPEEIVEKIVHHPRGGYCYEVNGLLAMALTALGFEYKLIGARPMFYPVRRPKTHMVLVVKADNQWWLCDTGFGSYGIREPMSLSVIDTDLHQGDDVFRMAKSDSEQFTVQALVEGEWVNQFGFDLYPHEWVDFFPANFLNSKHPDTIFVQKLLVIKHTLAGRKILLGNRLKVIEKGVVSVRDLIEQEIEQVLWSEFGLKAG